MFWTFSDVCPGFHRQDGSLTCMLSCLHGLHSSDSPLLQYLLTSWWPARELSLFDACVHKHWLGFKPMIKHAATKGSLQLSHSVSEWLKLTYVQRRRSYKCDFFPICIIKSNFFENELKLKLMTFPTNYWNVLHLPSESNCGSQRNYVTWKRTCYQRILAICVESKKSSYESKVPQSQVRSWRDLILLIN